MAEVARGARAPVTSLMDYYEGPTWVVAIAVYGSWGLLVWFHARVPWWLMIPLGALVIAWHNSLQHETIHALVRIPRPLRFALGFPPLALFVPYPIYCRSHRRHHRDASLTDPLEDPESYYHREEAWLNYPRVVRAVYLFNQMLVGRLTIGPLLCLASFLKRELSRGCEGDSSNLAAWAWHGVSVGIVLFWVGGIAGMPVWQYLAFVVYPGLCLGMLRSFSEHRYADRIGHRTAIVESGFPLRLLFLNNNLHLVHHLLPTLPWYRIPAVWFELRAELLEHNGGFFFQGYSQLAGRHALRPVFHPVHSQREVVLSSERLQIRSVRAT
jgi:fatty acid desaturase